MKVDIAFEIKTKCIGDVNRVNAPLLNSVISIQQQRSTHWRKQDFVSLVQPARPPSLMVLINAQLS